MAKEIKNKTQQIMNNLYKTINYNKLNKILIKEDWDECYNNLNVNECFNIFINKINSVISISTASKLLIQNINISKNEWLLVRYAHYVLNILYY